MRGIVIYDSSYGNTRRVAEVLAETLMASGIVIETYYVKDVKKLDGGEYDFMVLGSPTRCGTMSFAVKSFIGKLKENEWAHKPFAAFDTEDRENVAQSILQGKNWSAAEKIAARLRDKQMEQFAPVLNAIVLGWKGPLQDGQAEQIKNYAEQLATELKGEKESQALALSLAA